MMTVEQRERINRILREAGGDPSEAQTHLDGDKLRFQLMCGEAKAKEVIDALQRSALNTHPGGDGIVTDGGSFADGALLFNGWVLLDGPEVRFDG